MKTLKDLFELVSLAAKESKIESRTWFINYSGHINKINIRYYFIGWKENENISESLDESLTDEGIQSAYWFIKTRLL